MVGLEIKGLGRKLICHTLEYFINKGANHAILEVRLDNYSAINLYEKFGSIRFFVIHYRELDRQFAGISD